MPECIEKYLISGFLPGSIPFIEKERGDFFSFLTRKNF
jgi:hypothetical protein